MNFQITQDINSYLAFRLGEEIFATNVDKVLEVLEIQKITKVPQTPVYMRGVINLRGEVLPVIDTRIKFNMPQAEDTERTVIIVFDLQLKEKKIMLGAIADSVKEVLEINDKDIKPVPELGSEYNSKFIQGMYKSHEDFIMLLDIDEVFSIEELINIKKTTIE